jgi:hypothetical protein
LTQIVEAIAHVPAPYATAASSEMPLKSPCRIIGG